MKKLSSVLLTMALVLSAFSFAGCAPSTFDGNYVERSADEIAMLNSVIEGVDSEVNYARGYHFTIDMDMDITTLYYGDPMKIDADISMDYKAKGIDLDNIKLAGYMDVTIGATWRGRNEVETSAGEIYYDSEYLYFKSGGEKTKSRLSFEDASGTEVDSYLSYMPSDDSDLEDVLQFVDDIDSVKYYTDVDSNTIKVKVVFDNNSESADDVIKGEIYFVYDVRTYEMIGLKMDYVANMYVNKMDISADVNIAVDPWNGNIILPNDLGTYELA
ncbi:MAG: hypothetical protein IKD20_03720 [Clostridia bacterium]|nr:hypothetical protein [Clostridia bacterium]